MRSRCFPIPMLLCATGAAFWAGGCALIPETPTQPPADLDAPPVVDATPPADAATADDAPDETPTTAPADDDAPTPAANAPDETDVDETPAPIVDDASADEAVAEPSEPPAEAPGFNVEILRPGDGPEVDPDGAVIVRMTGRLADGAAFQRFTEPAGPWPVDQLVEGLRRGLAGMKVGGRRRITIPPELGYGDDGVDSGAVKIPPGATLVYEIDLIEVIPAAPSGAPADDAGGESP